MASRGPRCVRARSWQTGAAADNKAGMERGDRFDHPLIERYASPEMARLFSPRARHTAWRDLWIALARG